MKRALIWPAAILVVVALAVFVQQPLIRLRGQANADDARRLYQAGQPEAALAQYDELLELAARRGDHQLRIRALLGSARVLYTAHGDFDEALRRLQKGLALARELGDPSSHADALCALGIYYWSHKRQRHRSLNEFYLPAQALYHQADDRRGMAAVHSLIGLVHLAGTDYETSARHLQESRELYQQLGDEDGLGDVHRYLGALYGQLERYDQARQHYTRSLELYEKKGNEVGRRRVEALVAHLHLRRGEFERTIAILDRLVDAPGNLAFASRGHLVTRGNALLHLGRPDAARASYERALAIDERALGSDEPFKAETLTMLAHAHMQAGELDRAAASLARAEAISIAAKGWGPMVHHTLARADLADFQNRHQEALNHLLAAAEIENQTFGSARSTFFQSQYRQVFDRLFSLLFASVVPRAKAEELTFRFLEQMRYRSFRSLVVRLGAPVIGERVTTAPEAAVVTRIDTLSRAYAEAPTAALWEELRRAYAEYEDRVLGAELTSARYRRLSDERPIAVAELQRHLAADEALVEYVIAGERVFALVVTRERLASAVMPVTAAELATKVKLFRHLLVSEVGFASDGWRPVAAELGRLLVAPLVETGGLETAARLVLVPMGFLHDLPFAALADADGHLLIERYALLRSPSATLWARRRESPTVATSTPHEVVAFGLRQARGSRLAPLAFAEQEAAEVGSAFGGEVRIGAAATEAAFKSLAAQARRLHVATHGHAEPRVPLHSRLQLEAGDGDDGELTVREILDLGLSAELVSLSACGTGQSAVTSGVAELEVDRLGFVEAFLHAGSRSVLATLLPVSDAGSAAFMTAFYHRLHRQPPIEALVATQRQMLAAGAATDASSPGPDLRHPRYWAPFILITSR